MTKEKGILGALEDISFQLESINETLRRMTDEQGNISVRAKVWKA